MAIKDAFEQHAELRTIPKTQMFDFVVASHVLEHLPDPGTVLRALGAATRRGGWIYLSLPNLDRLPEHRDWKYVLNANVHLAAFSFDCLRILLQQAGFGHCLRVTLEGDAGKSVLRLRVLAQKGASEPKPLAPLQSALNALQGAGIFDGSSAVRGAAPATP